MHVIVPAFKHLAPTWARRTEFATTEAIDAEVQQLKKTLFSMRIKFAKREDYNPAAMAATRKRVAQLLTIKREREIANGVDKRASRAAERSRLVEAGLGKFA
jgi:ribosomal protein L29